MGTLLGLFSLTKLLSLFGGGMIGFICHMFNWHGKFGTAVKKVPSWLWITLAVVIAAVSGYFYHQHRLHQYTVGIQQAQRASDLAEFQKQIQDAHNDAISWKQRYETAQTTIANQERAQHEEVTRNNAAIVSALRLRGPGAASAVNCRPIGSASTASASGGHDKTFTPNETPGPPMPADDGPDQFAVVSWNWLTQVIQEHDDATDEAHRWRDQHDKQEQLHAQQTAPVKR